MTATAVVSDSLMVGNISLEMLDASQKNPRRTMDEAGLQELAASIRQHGIQNPLIVRPTLRSVVVELDDGSEYDLPGLSREEAAKYIDGSAFPDRKLVRVEVEDTYEIVCGHRRSEAATIAGLTEVPCIVREMDDATAAEIALVDNLQRVDLPPMEEAEAYGKLLQRRGATIETVAAALGKAPSYVGRRLKLLDAAPAVREALKHGAIEVGHALELARLDEAHQLRLLSELDCGFVFTAAAEDAEAEGYDRADDGDDEEQVQERTEGLWKPTASSVAELRRDIARTALMVLATAPFPLDDELPPVACTECPKRSGNAQLLFDDCAQDTCTDRDCYDGKVRAWVRYSLDAAEKAKRKLIPLAAGWTDVKGAISAWDVKVLESGSDCGSAEEAIWINGTRVGHIVSICRNPKCKTHQSARAAEPTQKETAVKAATKKEEDAKQKARIEQEEKYRQALFAEIRKAPIPEACIADLNLDLYVDAITNLGDEDIAKVLGWDEELFEYGHEEELRAKMAALAPAEQLRTVLLNECCSELTVDSWSLDRAPKELEATAAKLGIDPEKVRAGLSKPPKPKSQKKAAGKPAEKPKAPAKSKKPILSAEARKRIQAAQQKRWKAAANPAKKASKKGGAK